MGRKLCTLSALSFQLHFAFRTTDEQIVKDLYVPKEPCNFAQAEKGECEEASSH